MDGALEAFAITFGALLGIVAATAATLLVLILIPERWYKKLGRDRKAKAKD
jgi:hypothetical protein